MLRSPHLYFRFLICCTSGWPSFTWANQNYELQNRAYYFIYINIFIYNIFIIILFTIFHVELIYINHSTIIVFTLLAVTAAIMYISKRKYLRFPAPICCLWQKRKKEYNGRKSKNYVTPFMWMHFPYMWMHFPYMWMHFPYMWIHFPYMRIVNPFPIHVNAFPMYVNIFPKNVNAFPPVPFNRRVLLIFLLSLV